MLKAFPPACHVALPELRFNDRLSRVRVPALLSMTKFPPEMTVAPGPELVIVPPVQVNVLPAIAVKEASPIKVPPLRLNVVGTFIAVLIASVPPVGTAYVPPPLKVVPALAPKTPPLKFKVPATVIGPLLEPPLLRLSVPALTFNAAPGRPP